MLIHIKQNIQFINFEVGQIRIYLIAGKEVGESEHTYSHVPPPFCAKLGISQEMRISFSVMFYVEKILQCKKTEKAEFYL